MVTELNVRTEHRGFTSYADANEPTDENSSASHVSDDWVSDSRWASSELAECFLIARRSAWRGVQLSPRLPTRSEQHFDHGCNSFHDARSRDFRTRFRTARCGHRPHTFA